MDIKQFAYLLFPALIILGACSTQSDNSDKIIEVTLNVPSETGFELQEPSHIELYILHQENPESSEEVVYSTTIDTADVFPFAFEINLGLGHEHIFDLPGILKIQADVFEGPQSYFLVGDLSTTEELDLSNGSASADLTLDTIPLCSSTNSELCSNYKAGSNCGELGERTFVTPDYFEDEIFFQNFMTFETNNRFWVTDIPSSVTRINDYSFEVDHQLRFAEYGIFLEGCDSIRINLHGEEEVFEEIPYQQYGF